MSPEFGTPIVYVLISDPDQFATEFSATSLGNVQPPTDTIPAMQIDLNVNGMGGQPVQTLTGVSKFQPGISASGWRFYTPHELNVRGISGWPAESQ